MAKEKHHVENNDRRRHHQRHRRQRIRRRKIRPPPPPAKATGLGGYTYTQRVCQEYGRQPRWYQVRDGQAAYNGGNSDSGWLIIMERGGGGVVQVSYAVSDSGAYVKELNSDPANYVRFTPGGGGAPIRVEWNPGPPGYYANEADGHYVRIGTGWGHDAFVRVTSHTNPFDRYARVEITGGGPYIRWAHMAWCR